MRASLIIVSYNNRDQLPACLTAVTATVPADCEVFVVDNASTDGSPELVADRFPAVRLMRAASNTGFGGANNLAAARATGEYLVFLNPDTVVRAGWLDELLRPLCDRDRVGLTTGQLVLADGRVNACGNDVHLTGLTLCRGMGGDPALFATAAEVAAVSGAVCAMRRSLFAALGGFDADMFLYMEDTDLSWRTRLAGWRCWFTPACGVVHDYALRFAPRKVYYQERNRYLMLLKNWRWRTLLLLLPALALAELVTWGFVAWNDRPNWSNKWRAYGWVLTHGGEIRRKRAATQARRATTDRELLAQTTARLDFAQVSTGWPGRLADACFNPLFAGWRWLLLRVIWW